MTYRLYVGHDLDDRTKFCKGSVLCMNVIDKNPALEKMIRIENLNTILANGTPVPAWLHGTPTLVDVERKKIYYGLSARDTLLDIQPPVPESTRNFQKPPGIPLVNPNQDPSQIQTFVSSHEGDPTAVREDLNNDIDWDPGEKALKETRGGKFDPKDLEKLMKERMNRTQELAGPRPTGSDI